MTSDNLYAPPQANVEIPEGPRALWEMPFKELKRLYNATHTIRALGFLYGLGALGILVAVAFLASGAFARDSAPSGMLLVGLFYLLYGLLSLAACVTSFTRPRWGSFVGVALCILSLLGFPIGTIIGILGLIAYAQGKRLFGPDRFKHAEVIDVYKQRKRKKA